MKILYIVPSYKPAYVYGGPIESVAKLCEGIAEAGNEVHVYTTTANGATELPVNVNEEVNVDGVLVTYFKRITKDHTHLSPALWRQLRKTVKQYDLVHIQSWWNPLVVYAAYICYKKGVKFIVSPRGMLSNYIINSGQSAAKKLIHNTVGKSTLGKSYFHATADTEYKECEEIIPGWKGFVIPNILSLPNVEIKPADNVVFTMIFMSRIHPKKGIELLMEAISRLSFNVLLKIAGSGDDAYIEELKSLAEKLGITSKIEWLGWQNREQKFTELMNADLFVLTSYNENFANVVVESLHMGTAVLVSHDVALSSFVAKENMGWVTSLQMESILSKIDEAHRDKTKRLRIREEGRTTIAKVFAEKKLINDYIREYRKIL
ncbi:XrtY-associated glycosyltransferase XYAG1 [Mucilaginibacter agri]|uniref:Glycosyltransferase n=1 Tax=Mucilaginibacter agri TaxID=2695265 RepID=A0A965ZCU9_9SPHI|nr:glycosyltransferase [Mucilaginibacter agri]NCD68390.1 glycosyltransferase [Mucilaginibacter agri]